MRGFLCVKLLFSAFVLSSVVSEPTGTLKPCRKDDTACMTAIANEILPKIMEGFPNLGVDSSDPLTLKEIVGDVTGLKYKFTDSTATGFKNCVYENAYLSLEKMKGSLVMTCKNIAMKGHYTITGKLIILPVEGDGPYEILCRKYMFSIDADFKEVDDAHGNRHIAIKKYQYAVSAQEPITFDFKNLFKDQKDLVKT